jgi:HEAT repeat protein
VRLSFENLLETLRNPACDVELRRVCAWALGQLGDKRATKQLLTVFIEDDAILRWEVARALGIIGSKRAVLPLIDRLTNTKDSDERSAVTYALGLIGDRRAFEPLLGVLQDKNERRGCSGTRCGSARTLAKQGSSTSTHSVSGG